MKPKQTVYRLIHSQEMVQYMWRYTLHMQATQIPCAVVFPEALDFNVLKKAVNLEISRNDCLRLRVFRRGLSIRQYFVSAFQLSDIPVLSFATKAEQDAALDADAARKLNVFGGETFRILFFRSWNGGSGIYLNVSHMCMDAAATGIFFRDLKEVYDALMGKAEMPRPLAKYEDIIKNEQQNTALEARLAEEGASLIDWMAGDKPTRFMMVNGQKTLARHRKRFHLKNLRFPFVYLPLNDATHFLKLPLTAEESERIAAFVQENGVSPEWLFQLGFRLAFTSLSGGENDMLFWVLCPRRRTVKEKRCGGTLASPMPWREIIPPEMTFADALAQHGETQAFLFRHADVPFTEVRAGELKRFHMTLLQSANSMMFSYLPFTPESFGGQPYEYLGYNFGHYVMPLYAITLRDPASGNYVFSYIHRLWLSTDAEVERFHALAVQAILKGIAAPQKTTAQIMEELTC